LFVLAKLSAAAVSALIALTSVLTAQTQQEVEPNDNPAQANVVTRGARVTGSYHWDGPRDHDYFAISVAAGDTIFADVDANEFGSGLDPTLLLYGPDGTTFIKSANDWDGMDDQLVYVAPVGGTYYVQLHGFSDPPGPQPYTINFFEVKCPIAEESEPNHSAATAKMVTVPSTTRGVGCPGGDGDFFKFSVTAGTRLVIQVDTVGRERPPYPGAIDIFPTARLLAADGTTVLARTGEHDFPWRIEYDVTTGGELYLSAGVYPGGIRYPYILHLSVQGDPPPPPPPPPPTVTVEQAVTGLLRGIGLTAEQRTQLDAQGNQNGRYDVGDLRAHLVASGALTESMRALIQRLEVKP
jgi:hypothetical protein